MLSQRAVVATIAPCLTCIMPAGFGAGGGHGCGGRGSAATDPLPADRQAPGRLVRLCRGPGSAAHEQRRRAQPAPPRGRPQNQRRHPLSSRQHRQNAAGLALRNLAGAGPQPLRRMPSPTRHPTSLNSYTPRRPNEGSFGVASGRRRSRVRSRPDNCVWTDR